MVSVNGFHAPELPAEEARQGRRYSVGGGGGGARGKAPKTILGDSGKTPKTILGVFLKNCLTKAKEKSTQNL